MGTMHSNIVVVIEHYKVCFNVSFILWDNDITIKGMFNVNSSAVSMIYLLMTSLLIAVGKRSQS